jgi:two-component system chemotaxis response regulator CheY
MAKLKALVIDDSGIMRKMVMQSLSKTGLAEFEFVEASDGAEALTLFDPNEFDICFVDWNMPNMTGIEFVIAAKEKIKQLDAEQIPLVMVTSEKTVSKLEEALDQAGADAFISKPFTVDELKVRLKKPIQKAQLCFIRRSRRKAEDLAASAAPAKAGGLFGLFK